MVKKDIEIVLDADVIIEKVRNKNSRLPNVDFSTYKCNSVEIGWNSFRDYVYNETYEIAW